MIQYKKLIIKRGNQVIGYLYFQQDEILTIDLVRTYLYNNNISSNITNEEIQIAINSQYSDVVGDLCCIDFPPISPIINYTVVDSDTINFNITNYSVNQLYTIKIYDLDAPTIVLQTIVYTVPLSIDLDPGIYKFVVKSSTCAGEITRDYSVEIGNITITINLHGEISSTNIISGTSVIIPSFVGDSVTVTSSVISQLINLWKINSILINGVETINNEVYNITKILANEVLSNISFTADNIQQSIIIDIYSNYNTIEWCNLTECLECIEL